MTVSQKILDGVYDAGSRPLMPRKEKMAETISIEMGDEQFCGTAKECKEREDFWEMKILERHERQCWEYKRKEQEKDKLFRDDIEQELEVSFAVPIVDKFWTWCYQEYHGSGWSDVYNYFQEIVSILRESGFVLK